jgi:threonine dehydratase
MRSDAAGHTVSGFRCAVCGTFVDIATVAPWQCPRRTATDPNHVLHLESGSESVDDLDDPNPLVRYGPRLGWWSFARAHGLTDEACAALTRRVADGFVTTPFHRSVVLSDEIGVDVWVKDETGQVAGSQKGRHLASILLHLLAAEELGLTAGRRPLAIASCGNAALAAATLAHRVAWPIDVYVPSWMDPAFGRRLDELEARIHTCERRTGDPAGDPAMLRFREAVIDGAVPFSVQGPENALCLDGGRTTGWEIADQAAAAGIALDRVLVQVGGGAFAATVGAGLGPSVRLDTVQAAGCAPLAAAARRAAAVADPAQHWSEIMQPWPDPLSAADGILDDETYDWLAVLDVMHESGGTAIVATEAEIVRAHELATAAGFHVSVTGSAGLAGLLHVSDDLSPDARVAVVMSGVARD